VQSNGARDRALIIGTGWTLATAVALVSFKSAPSEPIYLWYLGLVALGWAGAVLYAVTAERHLATASLAAVGRETGALVGDLAQSMDAEMRRASVELARVDELLAHAVEQLLGAFNGMSDILIRQRSGLGSAADAARGSPAAEQLREEAARVARDMNGAVMALQFRDVVGQKLGHVRRELEALERVMQRVRAISAAQGRARAPRSADFATRVQGLLRELEQVRAASPAQQQLMHAGEVDLF